MKDPGVMSSPDNPKSKKEQEALDRALAEEVGNQIRRAANKDELEDEIRRYDRDILPKVYPNQEFELFHILKGSTLHPDDTRFVTALDTPHGDIARLIRRIENKIKLQAAA